MFINNISCSGQRIHQHDNIVAFTHMVEHSWDDEVAHTVHCPVEEHSLMIVAVDSISDLQ